jgi:hypothetical protein
MKNYDSAILSFSHFAFFRPVSPGLSALAFLEIVESSILIPKSDGKENQLDVQELFEAGKIVRSDSNFPCSTLPDTVL